SVNSGAIALWSYAESFSGTVQYLFSQATQPWSNRIQLYTDDTDGYLDLGLGDSHTRRTQIHNLDTQRWYHIALTWNGGIYVVYVDGTASATGTYTGLSTLESYADIGNDGSRSDRTGAFNGRIDEVRLYNRALSASEVSGLANTSGNTYTLSITAVNGSVTRTPNQASYDSGTTVTLQALANTDYNFVNWSGDASGSSNPITVVMDSNKSITANFAVDTYTLDITATNGSVTKTPDQASYGNGTTVTLQAMANTGYSFASWSGDASGTNNLTTVVMDGNKSVTANFTINTYTLGITATNGSVAKTPDQASYNHGTTVTLQATPNTGYSFASWSGDASGTSNPTTVVMDGNKSVTANFTINTYTLDITATNGSVAKTPDQSSYDHGTTVTLQATANASYTFASWSGDASGTSNPTTVVMDGNKSVTANFTVGPDETAPTVTNLSPQADSIQASLNTLVVLDITDSGDGVDANSVEIKVNGDLIYDGDNETSAGVYDSTGKPQTVKGVCRRTGNIAAYKYIYQTNEKFDFDQTLMVTVNANDLAATTNTMAEYSYSFISEMRSFGEKKTLTAGKEIISSGANADSERPLTTVSDSNGNVWVAWTEGEVAGGQIDNRDIYLGKLTVGAESFESGNILRVTNDAHDQSNPVLAIDSSDKIYLAWQDERYGKWDLFISTSANGTNWTAEKLVTDPNYNQTNPAMAIDSSDEVYIVYDDDQNTDKDIYIASSADNYVSKTQITSAGTGAIYDQTTPDIAIDSADTVYVVWADARNWNGDGNIKYDMYGAASNNAWTNIEIVDKDKDGQQTAPKIATEDTGTILHFVWVDDEPGNPFNWNQYYRP
ncbi:MAG: InlB B-repeat-containing protein, partial [Planctomycetota bacterium]